MKHNFYIEMENINLRPLHEENLENLRRLRNKLKEFFLSKTEISIESQKAWFKCYLHRESDIMFEIVKKENPEGFIGAIALYDINFKDGIAESGRIMIDKSKVKEKGLGTEALLGITKFGFDILNINVIKCEILKDNMASIYAHKKAGFKIIDETDSLFFLEKTK